CPNNIYVGGNFSAAGGASATNIARWDGSQWYPLGSGVGANINDSVNAIAISGSSVYAGGFFTTTGGTSANNIARWDGSQWHPLGSDPNNGVDGGVNAISVGPGPCASCPNSIYVGGFFTMAGGVSANNIARWDGSQWYPLGSGVGAGGFENVNAIGPSSSG